MPFHDLNLAYTTDHADLSHTLSFHHELGYHTLAIGISVTGKLPAVPSKIPISALTIPSNLQVLTRLTLTISDTTQNHRLATLQPSYDIIALRPTTEKTLQLCCSSLECDLISLDFSQRLPFILKFTAVASALQRGVRFEICYSPGIVGTSDTRRNLISGAASLIRATRGRGIIISSDARNALGVRAPWDVINLAQVWGLSQERGKEAVCEEAGKVIKLARIKRTSFRGVVDIIDNGAGESSRTTQDGSINPKVPLASENKTSQAAIASTTPSEKVMINGLKRKASTVQPTETQSSQPLNEKPLSKREMKRQAKKARTEGKQDTDAAEKESTPPTAAKNYFPIKHEALKPQQSKRKNK